MGESKSTRLLMLGGTRFLMEKQVVDSISNATSVLNGINSKLGVITTSVINSLNAIGKYFTSVNTAIGDVATQASSLSSQLTSQLSQLVPLGSSLLRRAIALYINNTTDQPIYYHVLVNTSPSFDGSALCWNGGVGPNSVGLDKLDSDYGYWFPYLTVRVWCSPSVWSPNLCTTPPTKGSVTIVAVRFDGSQEVLVDNLEIRDTNYHDASTDPGKIKWIAW